MAGCFSFRFQKFGRHNRNIIKTRRERLVIITSTRNLLLFSFVSLNRKVILPRSQKRSEKSKQKRGKFYPKNPKLEDYNHHHQTHQNHQQFQHQITRNVDGGEDKRKGQQVSAQFGHHFQNNSSFQHQNHQFYLEQENGHQVREVHSQLETQNCGPILENHQPVKKKSCLSAVSFTAAASTQHVRRKSSMGDDCCVSVSLPLQHQEQEQPPPPVSRRSALRRAGVGEIVEVQGGHIVRATGRKDRHSKVCTAKGLRDRRVRLSAPTAIQFYDVQDRLGYDRPSKAVDWLIKKAKTAIDELDQLPAWTPTSINISSMSRRRGKASGGVKVEELGEQGGDGGEGLYGDDTHKQQQQHGDEQERFYGNASGSSVSLLPPSMDSDAIADTIKSFFPMGGGMSSANSRPQMQVQDFSFGDGRGGRGFLTRSVGGSGSIGQSQDLRLSLQSFQVQDPILMHLQQHQAAAHDEPHHQQPQQHSAFHGAASVGFENPNMGWAESQHQPSPEPGQLHRLDLGWHNHPHTSTDQHHSGNNDVGLGTGGSGVSVSGFMFNQPPLLHPLFGGQHGHFFSQREPLQSSNMPSIRAWISDPSIATSSDNHQAIPIHPQGFSGLGFVSGGLSGFQIPARIQGEEEHDGDPSKPSSASSSSCH